MPNKILLVEDEALIAMAEAHLLKKHGYEVVTAHSGEKAVAAVDADPEISLILMDIDLGKGMDGTEAAEKILVSHDLPIVFLSSHIEAAVVERTEKITSYGYVVKNSGPTVLDSSIKMAFRLFDARKKEKQHRDALLHSQDLMRYIIEHNQSAVAVHDREMRYIFVSQEYLNQFNLEKRDIIGKHHYEVFPDLPQKWIEAHKKALAGEVSKGDEDPYEHEDGTVEWTRWECRPWYESDGAIGGCIVYTEVLSKARKTQVDLRDNSNYLQSILRTTPDGFWALDTEGNFIDVNRAYCRMSGYTRDEILRLKVPEIDADERPQDTAVRIQRIMANGSELFQTRHRRKDGSIFDVEVSASFLGGKQDIFICFCRDITERNEAEEELKASHDLLNATQRISGVGGWEWDIATDKVTWSDQLYRITGLDPEYPPPQFNNDHHKIYTRESWQKLTQAVAQTLENGKPYEIYAQMVRPGGEIREVFIHGGSKLDRDGTISGLFGIVEDITDKKRREKQLKESEENLRITLNSIGDAVISTDMAGAVVQMNPVAEQLCGWSITEARGKALTEVFQIVHAGTREPMENPVGKVLETGAIIGLANHTMLIAKDNRRYQIADSAAPIRDDQGSTTGVVLVFRDVTEEYRVAQALAESERDMARAQALAQIGSWRIDLNSGSVSGSEQARRIYGAGEAELTLEYIQSLPLPEDRSGLDAALKALIENGTPYDVEFRIDRPTDGTVRHIRSVAEYEAEHHRVVGTIQDITELKQAEEKLREKSKTAYQFFSESAAGAFFMMLDQPIEWNDSVDKEEVLDYVFDHQRITQINSAMLDQYLAQQEDFVGKTPGQLFGHDLQQGRSLWRQMFDQGFLNIDSDERRFDGSQLWIVGSYRCMYDEQGRITGHFGTQHDITGLKQAESNLRKALKEKDFLMRELNHRVKNSLTMVSSLISLKEEETEHNLSDIQRQIEAIGLIHQKLYQTNRVTEIDCRNYFIDLLASIFSAFSKRPVRIESNIEDLCIPTQSALALGLIINEIATNAIKHGFADKEEALFSIGMAKNKEQNQYILTLSNTGKPFPDDIDLENTDTLGLRLISALVSQIEGTLDLRKRPHPDFTIRFPIGEE